jgi:hypothetical protein
VSDSAVARAGERLLEAIAASVPVGEIDRLWLFPGRRLGRVESALAVMSLRPEGDGEETGRSRVVTYRFEVDASKQEPVPAGTFQEEGLAPPERVLALIEGVLRRLGDAPEELPRSWRVAGDAGRWEEIGREISGGAVDGDFGE